MSKRSNRGKAYFYAKGQRDSIESTGQFYFYMSRFKIRFLPKWAVQAWINGYNGY